jgi:hypothetical protein
MAMAKRVEYEVLRTRIEKAGFTLRKSILIARRQEMISAAQNEEIQNHLAILIRVCEEAFPPTAKKDNVRLPDDF